MFLLSLPSLTFPFPSTLLFLRRWYMIRGRWWIAQHEFTILEFGAFHNTPAIKKCKWLRSQNKIRPHTASNIYTLLNVFTKHKQTKKNPWVVHMYVPKVTKNTHLPRTTRSQNWTSPCQYAVWTSSFHSLKKNLFKFLEIIWHETFNLNSKLLFWILKINISIEKSSNWDIKWTFQFWILLFESENWLFSSEVFYLISKIIWCKIRNLSYQLQITNLYFNLENYWFSFKGFLYKCNP
jgi:hypothetical protein